GTNCHIVLEQPPTPTAPDHRSTGDEAPRHHVVLTSTKTARSLHSAQTRWQQFLRDTDPTTLPDIAFTSQTGRTAFEHRAATVGGDVTEFTDGTGWITGRARPAATVAFVYGGGGTQWPGMGRRLYTHDNVFHDVMHHCAQLAQDHIGLDLCDLLYGPDSDSPRAAALLEQTRIQQPALFAVQTAMTEQWRAWGVQPTAMVGHSLGEIVAATTASVWSLPDAMRLVCWRGELMQQQEPGAMLAVDMSEAEATRLLAELGDPSAAPRCVVAAVNGPRRTIVTGYPGAIDAVVAALAEREVRCRRLTISHAGHSPMMDPMLGEFERRLSTLEFRAPQLPIVSTVTGDWLSPEQATDPAYWAGQVRSTVRFSDAIQRLLLDRPEALLLEVGPGATAQLLVNELEAGTDRIAVSSMGNGRTHTDDSRTTREALAHLWVNGITIDWAALHQGHTPRRTPVPTYAFDTKRYWIEREVVDASVTATRFYASAFQPAALPARREEPTAERWLVFTDGGRIAGAWAPGLADLGELVTTVEVGETFTETGSASFAISPDAPEDFERLVQAVEKHTPSATWNVLYLWTTDTGDDLERAKTFGLNAPIHLARALGLHRPTTPTRLALVVEGLARTSEALIASPVGGIALGAAKTLPLEYPALAAGVFDVTAHAEDFASLAAEFDAGLPDSFVAYRRNDRLVEGIVRVAPEAGAAPSRPLREHGVYLITGGLGGIGALIATWLAENFKARLVLTGRTVLPAREHWTAIEADPAGDPAVRRAIATVRSLEASGAEVHLESFDVSDRPALRVAVERAEERFGPIQGVVHAAGLVGGKLAQFLRSDDMREVLAPKVDGTLALADVFRHHDLDLFAVFSSTAALLGSVGQADYCAANAFLDAWAESAEAPENAIAISWDAWRDLGMTSRERLPAMMIELEQQNRRVKLTAAAGLGAFERAIHDVRRRLIVSDNGLPDRFARRAGGHDQASSEDRSALPAQRSRAETEEILLTVWQDLLGRSGIEREANFFELGADSLLMIAASRQIKQRLGVALTVTDLFKYSTIAALAEHLAPSSAESVAVAATGPGTTAAGTTDDTAIAVIGMAARLPGADSVEAFWANLVDGVESITPTSVPPGQAAFGNRKYVAAAGAPDGVDLFDAAFFRLTPREAQLMDPQQRMLLMCSHEALEDAGYDALRHDGRIAVYVGTGTSNYLLNNLLPHQGSPKFDLAFAGMGNDKDFAASQISYRLNLHGPSVSVSTACSTALVAVAHACRSLLSGEADLALSGGAHVRTPERSGYWHQPGGMTSPDGHCRAFDADAAGTVFTSGVGIVVLKRLSDALRDGDPIRAVIRGSAVNNDGSDKVGFTAPSVSGQAAVIREAQQAAGVDAGSIGYVEAHGTATSLGDPIEVAALTEAFRESTSETGFCALGSVKTNVGHLDSAAGIAGFIKAVLCVERGVIPASLHFRSPNPRIDFEHSPFYVNTHLREWSGPTPRRAGVSSFGLGGTNCHIVLEQPPTPTAPDHRSTGDEAPRHHVV
ncbi:SDR family NAD(P)-dependent oxidoreductase, partial [Kitasatospora cystarginea]|uniref:SDR family NAD(P)-dependent oxidoreductase n=1 Tax=Kitasatospora cystarginea TaxID=58350 RepID=UPI0031E378E0